MANGDIEPNVVQSFRRVKVDIIRLQDEFMQLRETQVRLLAKLDRLERKKSERPVVKVIREKASAKKSAVNKKSETVKKNYVASKDGKKFHDPGCVSLKRVSSNKWVFYPSKKKAMAKGLKPCGTCIPR